MNGMNETRVLICFRLESQWCSYTITIERHTEDRIPELLLARLEYEFGGLIEVTQHSIKPTITKLNQLKNWTMLMDRRTATLSNRYVITE